MKVKLKKKKLAYFIYQKRCLAEYKKLVTSDILLAVT